MAKQSRPSKNKKIFDWIDSFRLKHKTLFIVLVVGVFALVFGGLLKFGLYQNKFSDKDYAAIEAAAEGIFKNIGGRILKGTSIVVTLHQRNIPMWVYFAG